jgi:hypothetical protein
MRTVKVHFEDGGTGEDLPRGVRAQTTDRLEPDFEKSGWIR